MEYQKMINLLGNENTQSSKFRRKYWLEINDQSHIKIRIIFKNCVPFINCISEINNT